MPLARDELRRQIEQCKPSWLSRASTRTEQSRAAGKYASGDGIWSEIKSVFVKHQRTKCAYCERRLGAAPVEWDVEHFRPKARVDRWDPFDAPRDVGGYYLLAHNEANYLVACKPCNSDHKRNYFPIAAASRTLNSAEPAALQNERALLPHPLDPADADPETLITFDGVVAVPRRPCNASDKHRARVTILVLGLNRPDLDFERCEAIMHLWNALRLRDAGLDIVNAVPALLGPGAPFTSCARSFSALFSVDRRRADAIGWYVTQVVRSHSL